uniref:Uncharacterized protein n=1 Tax=Anopheles christyi TaxID=43041 RepID=A0A182KHW5_9DIPT
MTWLTVSLVCAWSCLCN